MTLSGEPQANPGAADARSPLLFHYHIFKNAGSSVDRMLRTNFGDAWSDREFEVGTRKERNAEVSALLARSPELKAFSSHTAPLPVPDLPDRRVLPIIFVRHPLLRIRSAYAFHRRQDAATPGALLAKSTDLRGYVETYLAEPGARVVRDFQVARFAAGTPGRPAMAPRRALETISRLPFVGLVEAFEESIARLGDFVRPLFPGFEAIAYHENVTSTAEGASTDESLAALREELGDALYDRLLADNAADLALFECVREDYSSAR